MINESLVPVHVFDHLFTQPGGTLLTFGLFILPPGLYDGRIREGERCTSTSFVVSYFLLASTRHVITHLLFGSYRFIWPSEARTTR